ncbi:hypothetical protein RHMOL_Rhmol12G0177800 [Rhododendron molle]|uniref:Uncharacterized protein n=1 Tax=Rhododendron molle TaxID=49168 RepID=A0ACC0LKY6_RHOML|nr:hypothetical protein RHMOL_Rhmol12G0177800 [Rhododendron molle]
MDEPCDICGDIGVLEAIVSCSQCNINREHIYCRQPFSEDVPDVWLCQPCGIGSMSSSSSLAEDLPRTLTPNPSDVVDHERNCSAGSSKLPNYEGIVKTEKVEHTPVEEGEPYDISGNTGTLEAIMACCRCKIAREHMKPFWEDDPDSWLCEACGMGSSVSPKAPNMLMSDPLGMMQKENTNPSSRGKLLKWEKIGKTGKVKYIPAQEAIMLSSGAKNFRSPSKSNMNSKSGPLKFSVPISERTPIKPTAMSPKSSFYVNANPSFRLPGFPPTRNGNSLTNQVGQQEVTQTSKEPKEKKAAQAPRKEHFPMEQPADAVSSALETQNVSAKEDNVMNKASSDSPQAILFPPIVSSGKTCEINLTDLHHDSRHPGGNNGCSNVEPRKFNAENGDQMNILPKDDKRVRGPALYSSWKGSFKILDTVNCKELNEGFFAHPPLKVRRKVYEFSKAMPQVLPFTMIPRSNVWTDIFLDYCPGEDDIGLYFFSSNSQRSAPYICLLEFIEKQDLVMRSYVDSVELLVFTSKLLQANSQRWNEEYYFWGIFRGVKKHEAVCKHDKEITFPIQSSDCAIDMEIDMLAGKDVGRLDIAIPGRSSKRSCNSYRDEKATAISLHPEIPCVSRNFSFATQKPLLEVNNELSDGIPPGFEEMHRLNVKNKALTKMGRDGKSLMLDGEARNPEKENRRLKSLSEVLGAGSLQPNSRSVCY